MDDYSLVESGLDQPLPFDPTSILNQMDAVVEQSVNEGDPMIALNAAKTLLQAVRASGMALCRLLYQLKRSWDSFRLENEFEDFAFQELGLSKATIQRYANIGVMDDSKEIPDWVRKELRQRPMKDLVPIATAFVSGYDFEEHDWERLVKAEDNNEVLAIMRDVRNAEPRKTFMTIRMTRDGSLHMYTKDRSAVFIGYLAVEEAKDDEDVRKAINRILNSVQIRQE